jgi:hypothetical protein
LVLLGIGIRSAWRVALTRASAAGAGAQGATSAEGIGSAASETSPSRERSVETGPNEFRLIGNWESHKYHLETCNYAKEMDPRHRLVLKSHEQAKSQNYTPCRACFGTPSRTAAPSSTAQSTTGS